MEKFLKVKQWSGHEFYCHDCDQIWKQYDWYNLWPVRLGWHGPKFLGKAFFAWWGIENGFGKNQGDRRFNQTLRIGRLLIKFGPKIKPTKYDRKTYLENRAKKVKHANCNRIGFKHVACEHCSENSDYI